MEENIISLLTEALKFYAEPDNYDNNKIINDRGHHAKFAIELTEKNRKTIATYEKEFDELMEMKEEETSPEEFLKEIIKIVDIEKYGR